MTRYLLALLLVAPSGAFAQQTSEEGLALVIGEVVELRLQQLYVTVTGDRKKQIVDLDRDAFRVFDDGRRQEIVTFQGGEIPITALLVVDGSQSMRGQPLRLAREGVEAFVEKMRPLDEASVLVFSDRLLCRTPFTRESEKVRSGLDGLEAVGGSAVHDHLYLALKLLEQRQGRRVAILLSDGWDGHSVVSFEQLDRLARVSQSLVYWVRRSEKTGTNREGQSLRKELMATTWADPSQGRNDHRRLGKLVRRSGGRILEIDSLSEVDWAFGEILHELRAQFAIGYYPDPPPTGSGNFREVEVKLAVPGLKVRTREGYVDR